MPRHENLLAGFRPVTNLGHCVRCLQSWTQGIKNRAFWHFWDLCYLRMSVPDSDVRATDTDYTQSTLLNRSVFD